MFFCVSIMQHGGLTLFLCISTLCHIFYSFLLIMFLLCVYIYLFFIYVIVYTCICFLIYLLVFLYFHLVFLVNPVSVTAVDGTTAEFTCTANGTDAITYRVNDTSAGLESVISKGFTELVDEEVGSLITRRNLTVTVSSLYNNTEIFCRAVGSPLNTDSAVAVLIVQGIHAYK